MTLNYSPGPRVLSVQSHVVSGYCGNKSAVFPLQLLEFEVDIINTVQLSNHTQYETTKGQIFTSKDIEQLHSGLKANNLLHLYDLVLSGYVADISYIESMSALISDIKEERGRKGLQCFYTLDPVLGDDGVGYYVPGAERVAEAYRKYLVPLADIITPNRFEASILSGVEIDVTSKDAVKQALNSIGVFHKLGVKIVVITSMAIKEEGSNEERLTCLVSRSSNSTKIGEETRIGSEQEIYLIRIPRLNQPFTGTGDLFAALFTGWLYRTHFNLVESLKKTANSIHEILENTLEYYNSRNDGSIQSLELRLVQNRESILNPGARLQAEKIISDS